MVLYTKDMERQKLVLQDLCVLMPSSKAELLLMFIVLELVLSKKTVLPLENLTTFNLKQIADEIEGYYDAEDEPIGWIFDFLIYNRWLDVVLDVIDITFINVDTKIVVPQLLHEMIDLKEFEKDKDVNRYFIANHFAYLIADYHSELKNLKFEPKWIEDKRMIDSILRIPVKKFNRKQLLPAFVYSPQAVSFEYKYSFSKAKSCITILDDFLNTLQLDRQLDAFFKFATSLKPVNNKLFIPFNTLSNDEFNIVHILWYLKTNKEIELLSWTGKDVWEVTLLSKRLLSLFNYNLIDIKTVKTTNQNVIFVYNKSTRTLLVNKIAVPVSQSLFQCHLLEVIIDEKPIDNDLGFIEIGRIINSHSDAEDDIALRTRYYNAASQLSKKIAAKTGIQDIFQTTRQLIRFNPMLEFEFAAK